MRLDFLSVKNLRRQKAPDGIKILRMTKIVTPLTVQLTPICSIG